MEQNVVLAKGLWSNPEYCVIFCNLAKRNISFDIFCILARQFRQRDADFFLRSPQGQLGDAGVKLHANSWRVGLHDLN